MSATRLHTARLCLVAQTAELARAEIEDRAAFAEMLMAEVPPDWPPPLNDQDSMAWALRTLEANPEAVGWVLWYLLKSVDSRPHAIGVAGFKGPPAGGVCEVGYSVMPNEQRLGFATEALEILLQRAFATPGVTLVTAHTLPNLRPSIAVLEKSGFGFDGAGEEAGTIRYCLPRETFISRGSKGPA